MGQGQIFAKDCAVGLSLTSGSGSTFLFEFCT